MHGTIEAVIHKSEEGTVSRKDAWWTFRVPVGRDLES